MPHRAPLRLNELAQIWDEHPSEAVLQLLWEIHRLQSTIRRAQQVREMMRGQPTGVPSIVWLAFEGELDAEPCLKDSQTERQRKKIERWSAKMQAERDRKLEKERLRKEVYPELDPVQTLLAMSRAAK